MCSILGPILMLLCFSALIDGFVCNASIFYLVDNVTFRSKFNGASVMSHSVESDLIILMVERFDLNHSIVQINLLQLM